MSLFSLIACHAFLVSSALRAVRRGTSRAVPVLLLVSLAAPALAQKRFMDPGGYRYSEFSGNGLHLPVDCRLSPQAIAAWARNLTPTQSALAEANRRGYIAVADTGYNLCEQGLSVALLGFEKPGVPNSAVTIIVRTQVNPENGEPFTTVTGGMLVLDYDRRTLVAADDVGALAQTDGAFAVDPATQRVVRDLRTPAGLRRMSADDPVEEPSVASPRSVERLPGADAVDLELRDPLARWPRLRVSEGFKKFIFCLSRNANICVLGAMLNNPTRFTTAQGLIQAVGACVIVASVSCFGAQ